jgi:hypothetical protein
METLIYTAERKRTQGIKIHTYSIHFYTQRHTQTVWRCCLRFKSYPLSDLGPGFITQALTIEN